MRVLVLGATGRLGRILRWGWRSETRLTPIWHGRTASSARRFQVFDIVSNPPELQKAVAQVDVILCLAGVIGKATGEKLASNRSIALAARNAARGKPLLIASSAAVYGRVSGLCREQDDPQPIAPYGAAKLDMERAVLASDAPVTCLRIGNVAGADQVLAQIPYRSSLTLDRFSNGRTPCRSYVGPETLARLLADLVISAGSGCDLPEVLNIAAPGGVEMGDLLDAAPHAWTPRAAPKDAIPKVVLDTKHLSRFVNLDPQAGHPDRLIAEWRAFSSQAEFTR